jgi:polyisoprenoid-binding protein YceI
VSLRIRTASIDTGQADRDAHLRSADFLDVETYPEIVFVSTDVEQVDEETYTVTGDLTIRDTTRPVSVDFTLTGSAKDPFGNTRVGFEGALAIKRSVACWSATASRSSSTSPPSARRRDGAAQRAGSIEPSAR